MERNEVQEICTSPFSFSAKNDSVEMEQNAS